MCISTAVPVISPIIRGWCIITLALGNRNLLPFGAALRSIDPMLIAIPVTTTFTGAFISFIVSYMDIPALIEPPGVLM